MIQKSIANDLAIHWDFSCNHLPSLSENESGTLHIHSVERTNKRRKGRTVRMGLTKRPNNSPIHPGGLRSVGWTRTVSGDIVGIKSIASN